MFNPYSEVGITDSESEMSTGMVISDSEIREILRSPELIISLLRNVSSLGVYLNKCSVPNETAPFW